LFHSNRKKTLKNIEKKHNKRATGNEPVSGIADKPDKTAQQSKIIARLPVMIGSKPCWPSPKSGSDDGSGATAVCIWRSHFLGLP
jgi:hypothetical protein